MPGRQVTGLLAGAWLFTTDLPSREAVASTLVVNQESHKSIVRRRMTPLRLPKSQLGKENSMAKVIKTDPEKSFRRVLSASTLCGDSVKNRADENLGNIKELMIDIPSGRVAYAVLSFGGFLGLGDKLFAVPWDALTLDEDRKCLVLDADKAKLESAPGFNKDAWPDMTDTIWGERVHSFYGQSPYWTERKGAVRVDIDVEESRTGTTGRSHGAL
jgi:sporulation protein YlmC with PRC-barrel domain